MFFLKKNAIIYGQNKVRKRRINYAIDFHNKPPHDFLKTKSLYFNPSLIALHVSILAFLA
jgi:hypothetical protein